MKYSAALVAALAAFATAADLSIFPECSRQCITDAAAKATTCGTDYACVCEKMNAVKEAAVPCVLEKCGADVGIGQVLPAADKFCDEHHLRHAPTKTNEPPKSTSSVATGGAAGKVMGLGMVVLGAVAAL
ncbi:hypothetical protein N0V88_002187 [Collariella sp. IMI 366227]|nr:hypothetical protein N0V88_002187 [Collariella sp. IMI 366227]